MNDIRPDSADTLRLLDEASEGNAAALGRLLERHAERIRASVESRLDQRVRSRLDPSDVIQNTCLAVAKRIDEYLASRPMPFRLWVQRETHQQLQKAERMHLRAAKRAVAREVPLPDRTSLQLARAYSHGGQSPTSQAELAETATRVRQVLARLAVHDREIISLRSLEGLTNAECACLLGIDPEAAKKRYVRSLRRLRAALRDEGLAE